MLPVMAAPTQRVDGVISFNWRPVHVSGVKLIVIFTPSMTSTPSMNAWPSRRLIGFLLYCITYLLLL